MSYFKPVLSPYFSVFTGLFLLNQLLEYLNSSFYLARAYLDDLLVVPIVLAVALSLLKWIYKNKNLTLDLSMVFTFFILISLLFEFILPRYSTAYTSDYLDVVCYAFGSVFFWFFQNK